jgi:hypothetical protein
MMQTLQILQVILFSIPILTLLAIGVIILFRPVSILNLGWFLVVLVPLLLANTLTILGGDGNVHLDWRAWLILGADLALIAGAVLFSRGFIVYGLTLETVERIVVDTLTQIGFAVDTYSTEKRDLFGKSRDARLLTAEQAGQTARLWITASFHEVLVRPEPQQGTKFLRQALPTLRDEMVPYDFKTHAVGVLYIILALVFAILTWIFFFEPRFILIN